MEGCGKKIEPVPVLSHQELSMSILSVLVRVHAGKYVNVCVCVHLISNSCVFLNIYLLVRGEGKVKTSDVG